MAIKSSDQITIVDITDAYSVMLTSEAYTFVGGTDGVDAGQSCTTEVVAFCGTNPITNVTVNEADIICPDEISATVTGSGTDKVKITFTITSKLNDAREASIPVVVDGITVNKKFSFAVARTGSTGATGEDAISLTITSSNGTVFKSNTESTVLTAHVWKGSVELTVADDGTVSGLGTITWYKSGSETPITAKILTVSADDVLNTQKYTCQLVE